MSEVETSTFSRSISSSSAAPAEVGLTEEDGEHEEHEDQAPNTPYEV